MVKMFLLIAISFAFFCTYPIAAQSQPSIPPSAQPNNQKNAIGSNEQANQNNKGGESLKTPPGQPIPKQNSQETYTKAAQEHHGYDHLLEILLVLFNGLLALFTFLLWKSTKKLWKVSLKQSKDFETSLGFTQKAADAAQKSADILPITERAYVFATVFLRGDLLNVGKKEAWIDLKNCGRTPAIIKECFVKTAVLEDYPINETLFDSKISLLDPFIDGNTKITEYVYKFPISEDDIDKIMLHHQSLFCFGCIKYITLFGQEHFHGFCWEYDIINQKFVLSDNGELNYST